MSTDSHRCRCVVRGRRLGKQKELFLLSCSVRNNKLVEEAQDLPPVSELEVGIGPALCAEKAGHRFD